jgi:threonine/homoserine/homoserine lactone efflux protein
MDAGSVLAFWSVALLLIAVPGPDWAFVLGARPVAPAVAGLVLGYLVVTAVVAAGAGAVVAGAPGLLTAVTLAGGGYLVWLGLTTAVRAPGPAAVPAAPGPVATRAPGSAAAPAAPGPAPAPAAQRVFVRGIGVSGLNPKGLLIFVAVLPQFTDPGDGWPVAGQIGLLGLTFAATGAAFYLGLGRLARAVLSARPAAAHAVTRLSGVAMVGIGVFLIVERLLA